MRVFLSQNDYNTFIYLFRKYLEPDFKIRATKIIAGVQFVEFREPNYLYKEVSVLAYCLMPNHFHLIIHQENRYGMTKLLSRVLSAYSRYFSQKYGLVGSIWDGTYKAVYIKNQEHLFSEISYVHANPIAMRQNPYEYKYSSLGIYSGEPIEIPKWIKIENSYTKDDFDTYLDNKAG